jgi:D-glycero-D-manno-heptose 1,7-bisphosphate phosphatase
MHFEKYSEIKHDTTGLIIFDRDGTLIENIKGLSNPELVKWLPERIDTLKELTRLGYTLAIATNQGAVEEGIISDRDLLNLHNSLVSEALNTDIVFWSIVYCPHGRNLTGRFCQCRKPRPGMIDKLFKEFRKPNLKTALFGDNESDIQSAISSGLPIEAFQVREKNFKDQVISWAVGK